MCEEPNGMPDIDALARRPAAYLWETGLPWLTGGLVFFIGGSAILIQQHFVPPTLHHGYSMLALQWAGILCAIAVLLGAGAIKRRILFPRGGYVAPLASGRSQRRLFFAVFALVAFGIWAFARGRALPRFNLPDSALIWPGFALVFAVICLYGGWQQKIAGMTSFGVYMACLAPLLWFLPGTDYERGACLQIAAGAPMAVAGALRLRRFLKANPTQPEIRNE
jgi:hypothetical protein